MPNITTTFLAGTKLSTETDYGSSPSGVNGLAWWLHGRWFDVITTGLPTVQDQEALIFPAGHAGDRRVNQQPPVAGRQWAEGDFNAPVIADFLGVLLYAAMGSLSSSMLPGGGGSTGGSLTSHEPVTSGKSLVLGGGGINDGGNILRFDLESGTHTPITISISGIDVYGNGASETLTAPAAFTGTMYTRTSWSSIAPSNIKLSTGVSGGSISIYGIRYFTHNFTSASVAPTLAMERIGNPTAGDASANKSQINPGMVLTKLSFAADIEKENTLFTSQATFQGAQTGLSTKTTINGPSMLKVWPTWSLQVTRDGGTTWNVVTNVTMDIMTGNRNYMSAAGVQGPQGVLFGPVEMTGNISLLCNNEVEFNKWRGASEIQMLWNFQTPWKMTATSNYQLSASVPAYLEKVQTADNNNAWSLTGNYRVVRDDSYPFSFQLLNGTPPIAYSGAASNS